MTLPVITMEQILKRRPCVDPLEYAGKDWSGTALNVLRHPRIPAKYKLWVVLGESALPREILVEATCQFAERALSTIPFDEVDTRSAAALEATRAYMRGEITRKQLVIACNAACNATAACSMSRDAAYCAAYYAAYYAACDASATYVAHRAAQYAACNAARYPNIECKEQVKILIRLCKEWIATTKGE